MSKFKVGDVVEAVDFEGASGTQLQDYLKTNKNRFTVKETNSGGYSYNVLLRLEEIYGQFYENRFVLLPQPKPIPTEVDRAAKYKQFGYKLVSYDELMEAKRELRFINAKQNNLNKADNSGIIPRTAPSNTDMLDYLVKIEPQAKKAAKKYYKVVTKDMESLLSLRVFSDKSLIVNYYTNQWVHAPEDTRLFVFDNLDKAIELAKKYSSSVYECKIRGHIKLFGSKLIMDNKRFWDKLKPLIKNRHSNWKTREDLQKITGLEIHETESIGAKAVKLVKKVY